MTALAAGQTISILVSVFSMSDLSPHIELARWLADLLRQGITIGDDVTAYMEATFGTSDLAMLMADSEDSEIDSLLELIFYPDVEAQLRYESRWGEQQFTADQQSEIETALCATPMKVPLLQADDNHVSIQPPDFALAAFVQRLNITWQSKAPLARTLKTSWPGRRGLLARVHMRNARLEWSVDQVRLMDLFLSKIPAETDDFEGLVPFLLSILPELMPGTDPFEFLIAKKFFYFQSLCKAEDFERKRLTSNMEIMMLQGNRSAYGSMDEWRQLMRHIDTICRHLFGRTHFFQQPGNECIDLRTGDGGQHIKDVMRILS